MPYKQLTQFFGSKPNTPLLAHSAKPNIMDSLIPKQRKQLTDKETDEINQRTL